jgi:hypothetical protein
LEYLTKNSTLELIGVDFDLFKVESSQVDSDLESTHQDSIPKSIGVHYRVGVIMIGCVFIQTNELMSKGQKFIYTSKTVCATITGFKHPNYETKEGTIHSISPFFFKYCYVKKILTNLLLVKMKGHINKKMVEKTKRRKSLQSELGCSQVALEFDHEEFFF